MPPATSSRPHARSDRRLGAGLAVSVLLHGLLLSLQFGVPGLEMGGGAPLALSLVLPSTPPVTTPEPVKPAEPVATLTPDAIPIPPPAPSTGMRLVDLPPKQVAKPVVAPVAVVDPSVPTRPAARKRRLRAAPPPVIALDPQLESEFVMALPEIDVAAETESGVATALPKEPEPEVAQAVEQVVEQVVEHEAEHAAEQEAERLAAVQLDNDRLAQERLAAQARIDDEQRQARDQLERERLEQERLEQERLALERQMREQERKQVQEQEQEQKRAQQERERSALAALDLQRRQEQAELARQRAAQAEAERRAEADAAERALAVRRREQEELARLAQELAERERLEHQRQQELEAQQRLAREAERAQAAEAARQQRLAEERQRGEAEARAREQARLAAAAVPGSGVGSGPGAGAGPASRPGFPAGLPGSRASELLRGVTIPGASVPASARDMGNARRVLADGGERDAPLRLYVDSVRQKLERNAVLGGGRLSLREVRIDPVVSVALRSDGSVDEVTIVRSSGRADMDDAVRRFVQLNARYSAFPPNVAARFDVIEIRRIWRFGDGLKLLEDMR